MAVGTLDRTYSVFGFEYGCARLRHRVYGGVYCTGVQGQGRYFCAFVAFAADADFDSCGNYIYGFLYQVFNIVEEYETKGEYGGKADDVCTQCGLPAYGGCGVCDLQSD